MSEQTFKDRVAIVTGGASGIGRATAILFASRGARVAVADRDEAGGAEVVKDIQENGGEALFVRTDVSRSEDVERLVEAAVSRLGGLHCAFNNAGIEGRQGVGTADLSEDDFARIISVNLTGVWLCMRAELRHMLKHGGGTIVNTSSTAGLVSGMPAGGAYAASKHGVIGLTRTAAKEYAAHNIRINSLCPGATMTPLLERIVDPDAMDSIGRFYPMGRIAKPEELAESVLWLCSPASSYVNGHSLLVDGGRLA